MTLAERARSVESREDFVAFVAAIAEDFESHRPDWLHRDLPSFLAPMASWSEDMDGFYENTGESMAALSPWRIMADILAASRIYE